MKILRLSVYLLVLLNFAFTADAALFAGHTYNVTEGALNNTNVTIEIWNDETAEPSLNSSYSALSDGNGYWNLTIADANITTGKSIKFIPRHYNGSKVDFIGASLPPFFSDELTGDNAMMNISDISFYLKEGATINITAVNSTGGAANFTYMVKDTKLGFSIESSWVNQYQEKIIYLPADRNYSIEIFPTQAMPVFYDLNNLSNYTAPKKVDIIFNTTTSPIRVTGRFNLSNGTGTFDAINIITYLLEPGNMVFGGQTMPYNMSAWDARTDIYNSSGGLYNITLQGTSMNSNVLIFALAQIGGDHYGAFRNASPTAGTDIFGFNFILYKLTGSIGTIAVNTATGGTIDFNMSKTRFSFVNSSNDVLTTATGHLEVELDYSNLDSSMPDFTWMLDVQQSDEGSFTLPLLNYSVKKLNMFTQAYAPLKLTYTAAQIAVGQVNITMRQFNPGGIDSDFTGIDMEMLKSSAVCDAPDPPIEECVLAGGEAKDESEFKPLNSVVSGGKISFRIKKDNIVIHYKNVDMIASGPPDAAFDESARSSSSGNMQEEIWRFGSLGPDIYESVLIGFPYSGIDDSQAMNISLPYLYDNSWDVLWNTSINGTGGITANLSDYSDYNETWFSGINCSKTDKTQLCFVNTTTDTMWIQLPHFSGVGPSVRGTASPSSSTPSSGGGGGTTIYQCNDGIDNDLDGFIDYPNDPECASKYIMSEGVLKTECAESWICADWPACEKGKQTRECADYNKCGTEKNKPITEQSCTSVSEQKQETQVKTAAEKPLPKAAAPLKWTYNKIFTFAGIGLVALLAVFLIIRASRTSLDRS